LAANPASDAAAMAAIEDHRKHDTLVQRCLKDPGHLAVSHIKRAQVRVRWNQRAIDMDQPVAVCTQGKLVSREVDAKRAVTRRIEDYRVALLRKIDQVSLHRGEYPIAGGLIRRQHRNARPCTRARRVRQQRNVFRRKAELGTCKKVGDRLRVVHRACEVPELPQHATPRVAVCRMTRRGALRLIGVNSQHECAFCRGAGDKTPQRKTKHQPVLEPMLEDVRPGGNNTVFDDKLRPATVQL
jgi:hypothetical protein